MTSVGEVNMTVNGGTFSGNIYGAPAVKTVAGKNDLRIRTANGDLGALLVKGADNLEWKYYGSVGAEWSTRLAAI